LSINHFSSIIILLIAHKYSLKNITNSSGFIFSEIVVNPSISEKNIEIIFLSQSRLIFHSQYSISFAISLETYCHNALFNLVLFLSSKKDFKIFETVKVIIREKIN